MVKVVIVPYIILLYVMRICKMLIIVIYYVKLDHMLYMYLFNYTVIISILGSPMIIVAQTTEYSICTSY